MCSIMVPKVLMNKEVWGGHGLGIIILIRVALAKLLHRCGGVSVVVRAANIEKLVP